MSHIPVGSPQAATYRIIAAFLQHAMFGRIHCDCRNGLSGYWNGYGDGVRREYFEHFPQAHQRFEALEREKTVRLPAHRFWFLLKGGEPVLAFEPKHGLVWDVTGRETDLFAEYQRHHKIRASAVERGRISPALNQRFVTSASTPPTEIARGPVEKTDRKIADGLGSAERSGENHWSGWQRSSTASPEPLSGPGPARPSRALTGAWVGNWLAST
jgi:hypothetical protein